MVFLQLHLHADCPPGYGLWPELPPPTWPAPNRHLLAQLPAVPDLDQGLDQILTAAPDVDQHLDQSADEGLPIGAPGQVPEASAIATATQPTDASDSVQILATALAAAGPVQSEPVQATDQLQAAMQLVPLAHLQVVQQGLWLPDPLPAWSSNCMPCPVNYYSPGGQQGFAQCRPCPGTFTTAGATAAANCLCEWLLLTITGFCSRMRCAAASKCRSNKYAKHGPHACEN